MSQFEKPFNPELIEKPLLVGLRHISKILFKTNLKQNYQLGLIEDYIDQIDTREYKDAFEAVDVLMRRIGGRYNETLEQIVNDANDQLDADVPDINEYLSTRKGCLVVSEGNYRDASKSVVLGVQKEQPSPETLPKLGFVTESGVLTDVYAPHVNVVNLSLPEQRLLSFYL